MTNAATGWSQTTVEGKPVDVFQPITSEPLTTALLYLHSLDEESLNCDEALTAEFARQKLLVLCPRGSQCWWLDRPCASFDDQWTPLGYLREVLVEWVGQQWGISPPGIGLLGLEMGGQGVLQLAYRWPRTFPVVAAISPAVDFQVLIGRGFALDHMFQDAEAARQETITLQIHPLNWPASQWFACDPADDLWFDGTERLASKLSSMGILHEADLESTMHGDRRAYAQLMFPRAVSYLTARLRSRPLPY